MIDDSDHAEHPLHDHAIMALAMLTKVPIDRLFAAFAEAQVTQDLRLLGPGGSDLAEVLVMRIGGGPLPVNDLPLRGNQPTLFDPNDPAMVADAFLTDLGGATPLANRVDQFDTVAINHTLCLRHDQKVVGQRFILRQQTQQTRAFG